jgi:uncharacterized protein YdeI (YjbR/CyaY-like superfamily)
LTPNAPAHPTFFAGPAEFRRWLELNHDRERELVVGFWKTSTGKPSMTWAQSVDEALCFGWIDGVRRSLGDESYTIRFTPRRRGSVWSAVNVRRARELIELGRMTSAGLKAFEARRANRSGIYSYEQRSTELPEPYAEGLRANAAAWEFFQSRPASYRKAAMWWIVSAKKEETRLRRLTMLIEDSARGRTVKPLTPPSAR